MYLQLQTRFNPFTYDEMVKPLADYGNAYRALESQYATLQQGAEQFRQAVESDSSQELKDRYHGYTNALSSAINDFSQGMTVANRSAFIGLRGGFARDIQPIQVAFVKKAALADEQRKAAMANPSMIFEKNAADMSLEEFIKNPMADYGRSINGNLITAAVIQKVKGLAQEARTPEGKAKLRKLFPFQYEMIQENGFSMESINEAINRSSLGPKILMDAVDDTVKASGVLDWNNEEATKKVYYYAGLGLYEAHGATQRQIITDNYGMSSALKALDHKYRMEEIEATANYKNNSGTGKTTKKPEDKPQLGVYSTQTVTANTNYNKGMDKAQRYINAYNKEQNYITKVNNGYFYKRYGDNIKDLDKFYNNSSLTGPKRLDIKYVPTIEKPQFNEYRSAVIKRNQAKENLKSLNKEYGVRDSTLSYVDPRRYTKKPNTAEILTATLNVNDSSEILNKLFMDIYNKSQLKNTYLKGTKTDKQKKAIEESTLGSTVQDTKSNIYLLGTNLPITGDNIEEWGNISNAVINISNNFNVTASFKDKNGRPHTVDISKEALYAHGLQRIDDYENDFVEANNLMMNLKPGSPEFDDAKNMAIKNSEEFFADLANTVRASYSGTTTEKPVEGKDVSPYILDEYSQESTTDSSTR